MLLHVHKAALRCWYGRFVFYIPTVANTCNAVLMTEEFISIILNFISHAPLAVTELPTIEEGTSGGGLHRTGTKSSGPSSPAAGALRSWQSHDFAQFGMVNSVDSGKQHNAAHGGLLHGGGGGGHSHPHLHLGIGGGGGGSGSHQASTHTLDTHSSGEFVAGEYAGQLNHADRFFRRPSHASLISASTGHASKDSNTAALSMSPTKAEKKISELASELAPDLQVSKLTDIDFTNRKINLGEKEMLLKGLRLEGEGDLESAIICYSRAGMHSKDPQISTMLIGNLHYKSGRLILALNFYMQAAQILSAKSASTRSKLDEFITYRNRGIINFRLTSKRQWN